VKTRTLTIGLVVLVVGIALAAVGGYSLKSRTTSVTSFTQPAAGEYVSAELVLNDSVVVVRPPASVGGMVPAQDVSVVNSADIGSYAVRYNSTAASSETYIGLRGDFNYVVFSSVKPTTKIEVTGTFLETVTSGLLVLVGIVCVVAGIIVAIVGALRKNPVKKAINSDDEYYAKRDSTPQSLE
jgi:multisubunit Na+/H+ antiporter MnhB subunit